MYWDENIDPYSTRNVTCHPMRGAFHASVPLTDLSHGIDRSRTFRPLDTGHEILQVLVTLGQSHMVRLELRVVLPGQLLTGLATL